MNKKGADYNLYDKFISSMNERSPSAIDVFESDSGDQRDNLIVVDVAQFKGIPREKIEDAFVQSTSPKFIKDGMSDADKQREIKATREYIGDYIDASDTPSMLENGGGGSIDIEDSAIGLIIVDTRTISLETELSDALSPGHVSNSPVQYSDRFRSLNEERVYYHEAAHATLQLDEAGSDFVASATLLNKYPNDPEVVAFLNHHADLRLIKAQNDPSARGDYGIENYNAIKEALRLHKQGDLPKSTEDLQVHAEGFDAQNRMNAEAGVDELGTPEAKAAVKAAQTSMSKFISESEKSPSYSAGVPAPASRMALAPMSQ